MIPLRSSEPALRFPRASLALALGWLIADLVSRLWPGPRMDLVLRGAFVPASPHAGAALALLFHSTFFGACVSAIFAWVFTPRVFERRGILGALAIGASGAFAAFAAYRFLHPDSVAPVLAPEAFLGALLGAFMRRDIWGAVDTFVIGPGWARVLEVPSYVLLFFWLFYLLVGNLLTAPPLSDAPSLYLIPFISFLWGFLVETLWDILKKWTSSSSSNGKSGANKS